MTEEMKKVFSFVVLLLILIAIPITVFVVKQQQELRQRAAPATTLTLTPSSVTKNTGEEFSLDVTIDTAQNQVVVSDIHLIFDPEKIEALSITNSSLFPNIIASGVVGRGTADITVGVTDVKVPVTGTGTVATVRFKALAPTSAPVSVRFSTNTYVGGVGEGPTNILVGSTPSSVTINDQSGNNAAAATVSPTPPLSPSPTVLTSITPSPSIRLTPTPTSTSSAEASGSAITILSAADANALPDKPTFQGKAPANSIVTITIFSTPKTATVSADANGNWVFTPSAPLDPGQHTVTATITDNGVTRTASAIITVVGASPTPTKKVIAQDVPVSGNETFTIGLVAIGLLCIAGGILVPFLNPKQTL
jgi:hypothetical protein